MTLSPINSRSRHWNVQSQSIYLTSRRIATFLTLITVFALATLLPPTIQAAEASWAPEASWLPVEPAPDLRVRSETPERFWVGADGKNLPFTSDDQILAFLHSARVVAQKHLSSGINKPLQVTLEHKGVRAKALFRTVQRVLPGVAANGPARVEAQDSFRFEMAAYKVSRMLGINRVPPVILRTINGKRGSLQLWIEDALTEGDLVQSDRIYESPARRNLQKQVMGLFDQLVYNFDRHQGNSLYDVHGSLWYIDHTRSFYALPKLQNPDKISVADATFYERLTEMDRETLRNELGNILSFQQVDALYRRRNQILKKIDQLIVERSRQAVLFDLDERIGLAQNEKRPTPNPGQAIKDNRETRPGI